MAITDNFTRANETPLASPYAKALSAGGNFNLSSNTVVPASALSDCLWLRSGTFPNDQESEVTVTPGGIGNETGVGAAVRVSTTGGGCGYWAVTSAAAGSNNVSVSKWVNGSYTLLTQITAAFSAGQKIKIGVAGTTLKVYRDGVQIGSDITGQTDLASGNPGLAHSSTTVVASISTFECTDAIAAAAQVPYRPYYPAIASWPADLEPRLHQQNTKQNKTAPLIPAPSPFASGQRAGTVYPAILIAHQDAIAQIETVASGVMVQDASDQPPRQFALAPQTQTQIGARWGQSWDAQSAPKSASWNVPPVLVVLPHVAPPASIWTLWVPPFVAPPRPAMVAPLTLVYGAAPPPRAPLAIQNVIDIAAVWVQTWGSQHSHVFTAGVAVTFRPAWAVNSNRTVGF